MTRRHHQRYQREFWPPMIAYIAIMFLLWPLLPKLHYVWLKAALALLPLVPVLFVVRAMVHLVLGSDELEQRIHLIGLAVAATVVSTLSLAGGFLAAAGIVKLDGVILIWVWPALVLAYAMGRAWARRRYGGDWGGDCDGLARHWQLWIAAAAFGLVALLGWSRLDDWQRGLLCGLTISLAASALVLTIRRSIKPRDET